MTYLSKGILLALAWLSIGYLVIILIVFRKDKK